MSWRFTVPGAPPSWNHSYRDVIIKPKGKMPFRTRAKTQEAAAYQVGVGLIAKAARPTGWEPGDQIRVTYDFFFGRAQDADNAMKMLNDALAKALDVNDSRFLPCTRSMVARDPQPRVEVEVD